jgi:hypothetical protein
MLIGLFNILLGGVFMLGFLCNNEDVFNYYTSHYKNFKPIIDRDIKIAFFTLNNIDLNNRVRCITASSLGIKKQELKIPNVIFNFSRQCKIEDIKKFKLLCELENLKIINETNQFNQIMIMEILSSFKNTKRYVLHYNKGTRKGINVNTSDGNNSFLIMPKIGSNFNKIIYLEQWNSAIQNKIATPSNKSLILRCPKLKLCGKNLAIARIFLQKNPIEAWKFLYCSKEQSETIFSKNILTDLKTISIKAVTHINNYIPSLGVCFIDFIFDENINPHFLHFGGWDKKLLYKYKNETIHKELCNNLIQYYENHSSELQVD